MSVRDKTRPSKKAVCSLKRTKRITFRLDPGQSLASAEQTALKSSQSELVTLQEQLQALALDEQSLIVKAQAALEPLEELEQNLKTRCL